MAQEVPITLNPYQGLKRQNLCATGWQVDGDGSNNLESLSGIETRNAIAFSRPRLISGSIDTPQPKGVGILGSQTRR
jgi:hypothetical protein